MLRSQRTGTSLLLLAMATSCTYDFPDPKADETYLCAAATDCADGFVCLNGVCLEEAAFGGPTLQVSGILVGRGETVYAKIGSRELSTAVQAGGHYSLTVPVLSGAEPVILYSRGSEPAEAWVSFASILGATGDLEALAGDDRELVFAEHAGVNLTPFTTVAYGGVCAANGGAPPATRGDLVAAEQLVNSRFEERELLDGAAALWLLTQQPGAAPSGVASTAALACEPADLRALVAAQREEAGSSEFAAAHAALMARADMTSGFTAAALPASYQASLKERYGLIGRLESRLVLRSNGTGLYQPFDGASGPLPTLAPVSWLVGATDGTLNIGMGSGVACAPDVMTGFELADLYSFPTSTQIMLEVQDDSVRVQSDMTGLAARLLARGTSVDWVMVTTDVRYHTQEALAPYDIDVDDITATYRFSDLWTREETLDLVGAVAPSTVWALPLVLPLDRGMLPSGAGLGTPVKVWAIVSFGAYGYTSHVSMGGVATVSGGVVTSRSDFGFQMPGDHITEIRYSEGATQRFGIWDRLPTGVGVQSWYRASLNAADEYVFYGAAVQQDPSFTLGESVLATPPGQYWQLGLERASVDFDVTTPLLPEDFFGWEFGSGGALTMRWAEADGADWTWREDARRRYRFEGGKAILEHYVSAYETSSTCLPMSDSACVLVSRREWLPVARMGDLVYVLETETALLAHAQGMTWSSPNGRWEVDGAPADLTTYAYPFAPRLASYFLGSVAALP